MHFASSIRKFFYLILICSPIYVGWAYTCSMPVRYEYTYLSWDDFRATVSIEQARDLIEPGNILWFQDLLLVLDGVDGVHVIDHSNPELPVTLGFLPIPGASQLAMKGDYLYVKSYTDIVIIDMSVIESATEVNRIEGAFYVQTDTELGVVIDQQIIPLSGNSGSCLGPARSDAGGMCSSRSNASAAMPMDTQPQPTGLVGSMASMLIVEDRIYAISDWEILTYSIENPLMPVSLEFVQDGPVFNYETIYYYEGALYFGGTTGVYIYSLDEQGIPQFAGLFEHDWQCDPVVVSGDYAFSTLRSGTTCRGGTNQLDILNVENIQQPYLLASHSLVNPHGLAIDNELLFIADGSDGLKLFEFQPPDAIELQSRLLIEQGGFVPFAYDVLVMNGLGILVGDDGLVWFDYSNPTDMQVLNWMEVSGQ